MKSLRSGYWHISLSYLILKCKTGLLVQAACMTCRDFCWAKASTEHLLIAVFKEQQSSSQVLYWAGSFEDKEKDLAVVRKWSRLKK